MWEEDTFAPTHNAVRRDKFPAGERFFTVLIPSRPARLMDRVTQLRRGGGRLGLRALRIVFQGEKRTYDCA